MVRLHALELTPDDAGQTAVRADWQALRDAGLPSQLDHRGTTNEPHVTLVATEEPVTPTVRELAAALTRPLLPVPAQVAGLVVFGGPRVTLAWALEVPDEVTGLALRLRAETRGHRHRGWLPHLTLARRLPREQLEAAVRVLDHGRRAVSLARLRLWDPDAATITTLVAGP
ncbi:2'-5' RNA ligase family protein [Nocardioides sp. SYSU D00038]|uniref:2'-5' RNA ligase family protein n=1 Tax=Nocardioides sp. SYSU D00038 TaxID=2812554 RepID=UPI001967DF7A|nr:2'-5' RNA ligase family protein [Nocardioides sp. SYSU D00038]